MWKGLSGLSWMLRRVRIVENTGQNQYGMTIQLVEGLSRVATQNEEIIRRLNTQNGRVDKLEAMQWRIIVYIAGAVGVAQFGVEVLFK